MASTPFPSSGAAPARSDAAIWTGRVLSALVILAICVALYAGPRTAVQGTVLLTSYLGGAVATHLRVASPLFLYTLFGVYLGTVAWTRL